eukprot:3367613-Amphidinium_carterae.1
MFLYSCHDQNNMCLASQWHSAMGHAGLTMVVHPPASNSHHLRTFRHTCVASKSSLTCVVATAQSDGLERRQHSLSRQNGAPSNREQHRLMAESSLTTTRLVTQDEEPTSNMPT